MKKTFREHYGHNFYLDINKLSLCATDCISRVSLFFVFCYGLVFAMLGTYFATMSKISEATDFEKLISKSAIKTHTFISSQVFGTGLIVLGGIMVIVSFFYAFRRKTVTVRDNTIFVTDHPLFGKAHTFSEEIANYAGVRLRLKFCQYDLFSRNKYIIELYHTDCTKIVPLYISTNPKHIRSLWKKYALYFNLPPIRISDRGMVSQSMKDLSRPYMEVVKDWHLPKNFLADKTHSLQLICKKKNDKKIMKTRGVIFDLYSTLNMAVIVIFSALLGYSLYSHGAVTSYITPAVVLIFDACLLTGIIYAFTTLLTRDIILINNGQIIIFRKVLSFIRKDTVVPFAALKGLDIFFTPTTGRYCLQIITDRKITRIFNKLSPDDLRWVKCCLIAEMIEEKTD
ncbi:MAG: hypothetical protein J5896_05920 [Alphaproteobacteria bacterium]|nr:hypothetical protein [Alphaproteobacteria bacterium]